MNNDTRDFLETLLFMANDPDCEETGVPFGGLGVEDFTPEFTEAAENFIAAFRRHLLEVKFPMEKLGNMERSFGGNVFFSLSGHGCGFFDEDDEDIARLQDVIRKWAGYEGRARRFEELADQLEANEDGKIDLAIRPEFLKGCRAEMFAHPQPQKTADARLIAAAPELLTALEAAYDTMKRVYEHLPVENRATGVSQATHVRHLASHLEQHAKKALAAIAKAKGAQ